MRRSSLGWGVVLLLLGLLMLADAAGLRFPGGAAPMQFFWPLLLVLAGGWIVLGVLMRPRLTSEEVSVDLQGATEASVRLSHGAGEFRLSGGAAPGQLATGTFIGGLEQSAHRTGTGLDVRLSVPTMTLPFLGNFDRYDWDMRLNSEIPMSLHIRTGAAKAELDLSTLRLTGLRVDTGASQTRVTLPGRGRLNASFDLGAASLTIVVPDGMAARVRVSHGVSNVIVNETRFPRTGSVYQSPDFDSAPDTVDITVEAGAAEVRVQ